MRGRRSPGASVSGADCAPRVLGAVRMRRSAALQPLGDRVEQRLAAQAHHEGEAEQQLEMEAASRHECERALKVSPRECRRAARRTLRECKALMSNCCNSCAPTCLLPLPQCPCLTCPAPVVYVPGPTGPSGPFTPSSVFEAAFSAVSAPTAAPLTLVPFGLTLIGNEDNAFNPLTGLYTAPAIGTYRFDFTITLALTGAGSFYVSVSFAVLEPGLDPQYKSQQNSLYLSPGTQSLTSGVLLQLLPGQQVGVACGVTPTGAGAAVILGPSSPLSPPYPTTFSATSLF